MATLGGTSTPIEDGPDKAVPTNSRGQCSPVPVGCRYIFLSELHGKLWAQEEHEQSTGEQMLSLQEQMAAAQQEQETLRPELEGYQRQDNTQWALKKEELLHSLEFYDLAGAKVAPFLEKGFEGAISQFREAGYPPEGASLGFSNFQKVLDNISNEKAP